MRLPGARRGALALLALTACEPGLSLDAALANRPCRSSAPRCLPGFVCNADDVCVPSSGVASAGSAGTDAGLGNGGSGSAPPGAGGTGSSPVAVGQGGTGDGTPLGNDPGDAGSALSRDDAAVHVEAPDGCAPGPLFQDLDGDGYGGVVVQANGCARDGLVSTPGDCFDADGIDRELAAQVHPGQLEYFFVGYRDTGKPGDISFDYDCSGSEERHPQYGGTVPACEGFLGFDCTGAGYLPDVARQGVAGVEALCGSEVVGSCVTGLLGQCITSYEPTEQLYLCR